MPHPVLLGDSVFDNQSYVGSGPDVIAQLRAALPSGSGATLLAVDGSVTGDVVRQLGRLPGAASHLVISSGGNDALRASGLLHERASSVAEVLGRLAGAQDTFRRDYRAMLDAALGTGLPVAVCTIYDPRYADPLQRRIATTALATFNDVITREAFSRSLTLLDLRNLLDDDADFANPIEPSVHGGAKMAAAIAAWIAGPETEGDRSHVFGRLIR